MAPTRTRPALSLLTLLSLLSAAAAHMVVTYPGWRGNNLISNGTVHTGVLGIDRDRDGNLAFPYGMQFMYPCTCPFPGRRKQRRPLIQPGGGLPTSTNRTKWPVNGGALALQPGWNANHPMAHMYVNIGWGTEPLNMSNSLVPLFQITAPTNEPYNSSFCLPQIGMPANAAARVGDNATIQIIESTIHGASLYTVLLSPLLFICNH